MNAQNKFEELKSQLQAKGADLDASNAVGEQASKSRIAECLLDDVAGGDFSAWGSWSKGCC